MKKITRQSLLYKTKVEYGDWTINHIVGCKHGCNFPCYAFMMAKRFGWIKNYSDWRKPRIVENAISLLNKEIQKYKDEISFVHLCFMTDPFMYDSKLKKLVPEIKELTLDIIKKLNNNDIRVTTLTKGFYPKEIFQQQKLLNKDNEYGITLVSLDKKFKDIYEPYSAPYKQRISSLKKLAKAGLKTWVSMEPYPTPNLVQQDLLKILKKISFVDKIIFGKFNYNADTSQSVYKESRKFYEKCANEVISFCTENNIQSHIKYGTKKRDNKTTEKIFRKEKVMTKTRPENIALPV